MGKNTHVVMAYRVFSHALLNVGECRAADALQLLAFKETDGGILQFGEQKENCISDYLFVLPPGTDFRYLATSGSPLDCVYIQFKFEDPRLAARFPTPAKIRVHSPGAFESLFQIAGEFASTGQVRSTLVPILDELYEHVQGTRITFADHAEGPPPRDTPFHSHLKEHQIDYYIRAEGRFWLDNRWEAIADGDLFYVPPGVSHATEFDTSAEYHNLSLKFVTDQPVRFESMRSAFKANINEEGADLEDSILRLIAAYLLYNPISDDSLDRALSLIQTATEKDAPPLSHDSKVTRARRIIDSNYSIPMHLDWLAEKVGLKPAYLSRVFRRDTGTTFSRYLRGVRVSASRQMLKETNLPVGQIARRCGFTSLHYFSQTFKEETGISPSEARKHGLGPVQ